MSKNILLNKYLPESPRDNESFNGKISIIMPAYNLRDKILTSVNRINNIINNITKKYEIIVVDDGSTDGTYQEILKIGNNNIVPVRNNKNIGKGYAVKKGILKRNGVKIMLCVLL